MGGKPRCSCSQLRGVWGVQVLWGGGYAVARPGWPHNLATSLSSPTSLWWLVQSLWFGGLSLQTTHTQSVWLRSCVRKYGTVLMFGESQTMSTETVLTVLTRGASKQQEGCFFVEMTKSEAYHLYKPVLYSFFLLYLLRISHTPPSFFTKIPLHKKKPHFTFFAVHTHTHITNEVEAVET